MAAFYPCPFKAENAVDMETGAILAVTTHGGAAADTATIEETVAEAGVAVAGLIAEQTPEGECPVHPGGVEEVVADKGYHSNEVVRTLSGMKLRTYIAEPARGKRNWKARKAEKQAVYANRWRIRGERGANGCSGSGEKRSNETSRISSTAEAWTGCMCGAEKSVHKKLLLQAAACNLALLMRSLLWSGQAKSGSRPGKRSCFWRFLRLWKG